MKKSPRLSNLLLLVVLFSITIIGCKNDDNEVVISVEDVEFYNG